MCYSSQTFLATIFACVSLEREKAIRENNDEGIFLFDYNSIRSIYTTKFWYSTSVLLKEISTIRSILFHRCCLPSMKFRKFEVLNYGP